MLKMTISTSVWSVQHPNAGRNIQHTFLVLVSSIRRNYSRIFIQQKYANSLKPMFLSKVKPYLCKNLCTSFITKCVIFILKYHNWTFEPKTSQIVRNKKQDRFANCSRLILVVGINVTEVGPCRTFMSRTLSIPIHVWWIRLALFFSSLVNCFEST